MMPPKPAWHRRVSQGRGLEVPEVFGPELRPAIAQQAGGEGIQRRRGDQEDAAGLEQAVSLGEQRAGIADVLDHVGKHAEIVACADGGKVGGIGLEDDGSVSHALAGRVAGRLGKFDAGGVVTPGGGAPEEVAASTAHLQQPGAGRDAVPGDQVEKTVGGGLVEFGKVVLTDIASLNRENLGAVQAGQFGVVGLGIGTHQAAVVAAHDAEGFHGELVEQPRASADGARGERAAGGGESGGESVGHLHG